MNFKPQKLVKSPLSPLFFTDEAPHSVFWFFEINEEQFFASWFPQKLWEIWNQRISELDKKRKSIIRETFKDINL